ncbi:hypothetical protein chiPu_0002353 [Chiloscyllium punctatum]|uniref:Uncharacterized protein n=1 Tax=Chiloscyllium punctatum TaxID=137246 RepID=A0A401S0Q3_CHIPU|nr:hypothetical protein [Chiloscyllium punctatum]
MHSPFTTCTGEDDPEALSDSSAGSAQYCGPVYHCPLGAELLFLQRRHIVTVSLIVPGVAVKSHSRSCCAAVT